MNELKCKVCGKLASEDSHFYSAQLLCNRHYLQLHRHGEFIPEEELNLKIKPYERICSYCGNDSANKYYRWHKDGEYKDKVLCSKHYNQLLRHGDFLEEIEKRKECQVCGSKIKLIQSRKFHGTYCQRHFTQLYTYGKIKEETVFDRNDYVIKNNIIEIILKNSKFEEVGRAIIDKEDLDKVIPYKWRLGTWGYAETGSGKNILMQRLIMNVIDDSELIVDHINRNELDNRKCNLRIVNKSQNAINSKLSMANTSGVKGVSWNKNAKAWRAYLTKEGVRYELGHSKDFNEAVRKRLKAERKYFGEYAPQKHLYKEYGV